MYPNVVGREYRSSTRHYNIRPHNRVRQFAHKFISWVDPYHIYAILPSEIPVPKEASMKQLLLLLTLLGYITMTHATPLSTQQIDQIYKECQLENVLNKELFTKAYRGYNKLKQGKKITAQDRLTIIDFTKPSTEKRLYVISLKKKKLLYNSYVAHGKNSGYTYAKQFSNSNGSLQSSLGFYRTLTTYYGKHGYSLKLRGLEPGINDKAEQRAIVIHGADYVSASFIKKHGRLGRSWGCPALPQHLKTEIINTIKGGSCLFIYAEDATYTENSKLLTNK